MAWNGIFYNGLYSMSFDMAPAGNLIFTQLNNGSATNSVVPFGTGYSWEFSTAGTLAAGVLLQTNLTTLILGIRVYVSSLPSSGTTILLDWYDVTAAGAQVTLRVNSSGQLQFFLGTSATTIGPASAVGTIIGGVWNYLETTVTISSTAGFVECRLNGVATPIITTTATQNTKSTANAWVNTAVLAGGPGQTYFDDWYMLDTTGSSPFNTYLGNVQVKGDKPNANSAVGGRNAWTPTNPTNVNNTNVGNTPANAAEYNADQIVGDYDMFRFPSISAATVLAINVWALLELDSAGARTVELNCYSTTGGGSTDSPSQAYTPATSVSYFNQPYLVDPNTGSAWTVAGAGAAELGVKVAS